MITELCIPLTMKIMGPSRPLHEAERLAKLMFVWVVLLCALMGYTIRLPDGPEAKPDDFSGYRWICLQGAVPVNDCGILPAGAGTAAGFASVPYTH